MSANTPPADSSPRAVRGEVVRLLVTALVSALLAFGLCALLVSIFGHKQEARNPFYRVVELTETTTDPSVWGKDFPQQYDAYLRTANMRPTRYAGSEAEPRVPGPQDPKLAYDKDPMVTRSKIDADPRLKTMWAGYAFATDYRERRGHAWMLIDQEYTKRQVVKQQPGTCINCHASMSVAYNQAGNGDMMKGFDAINKMGYWDAHEYVKKVNGGHLYPLSCIDCHNPQTMQLRVTKPAFIEGLRALKKDPKYDPNTMATRQEMRSYVCGQCHVEYYFKGKEEHRLTFPWANGLKADQIIAYYDQVGFTDWTHKQTGAALLKAQHPEFETYNQGIHARAGVACADCHMPYKRVGALKVSDHWVQSPLLNLNNACQTCHHFSEDEMRSRVENIQRTTIETRSRAMDSLVDLIGDLTAAKNGGATPDKLKAPYDCQRKASFLIDFVQSENSVGFHAPQETQRLLALAIDYARQGQLALRGVTTFTNTPPPGIEGYLGPNAGNGPANP